MAYSKHHPSHKKEAAYIFCIIFVTAILSFSIFGPGGFRELRTARIELQEKRVRVEELKRDNDRRMKVIEALRSDKEEWEKNARERNFGRDGEIIQQVP
jgi:hypothetical protein